MSKIVLVEDDAPLAELIASYLMKHEFQVHIISRGDEAREAIRTISPDLVILDLMLPGLDGLQVCRQIRMDCEFLPVLMLTARGDSYDQVIGLEIGADDFVSKPCEPRVLLARIRSLLRRVHTKPSEKNESRLVFGRLQIDFNERVVTWRDSCVDLSSFEFDVLVALAEHAGKIQTRDELLQKVRGIEFNGIDRSIDVAISKLRRKLEEPPSEGRKIKTVWGRGYLFSRTEWE